MPTESSPAPLDSPAWPSASPRLSVLIPTYHDDPTPLLQALDREVAPVEVVVLDDGGDDDALAERLTKTVTSMRLPSRFVRLRQNVGRGQCRNRLARHARAEHLLFLDSDMLPDAPDFLARWGSVAAANVPVAFGGFSLRQTPVRREHALHRALALATECRSAPERSKRPEKHLFTSNLLVRRDVIEQIGFDEAFDGWGWEDIEWAMRVARSHPIAHIDNPASHLGLDAASVIAQKYEQSTANFARLVASHAEIVSSYPSYRVARVLKAAPFRSLWRPFLKRTALFEAAPMSVRTVAMRLYRAALYSEAV